MYKSKLFFTLLIGIHLVNKHQGVGVVEHPRPLYLTFSSVCSTNLQNKPHYDWITVSNLQRRPETIFKILIKT